MVGDQDSRQHGPDPPVPEAVRIPSARLRAARASETRRSVALAPSALLARRDANLSHYLLVATRLEWWPDYNTGPLWSDGGREVDLAELGASAELVDQVRNWTAGYRDDRLPIDGRGDERWLQEGVQLLADIRRALGVGYEVVVTEPWWGEEPVAER